MCGILGINEKNKALIDAAAKTISYRGPDSYDSWTDEAVSLGFKRLAIIDLDARANQPMWDDANEIGIVYNGEIYNFKELKSELEQEFAFRTTSDTEVLIYGYKKYGPAFVQRLRGMFAYTIYDTRVGKLFLFRDHAGIKPLYYYFNDGVFVFASETKVIASALASKGLKLEVNRAGVGIYFGLGYIPSPHTLYQHLHKLPRGTFVEFDIAHKTLGNITPFRSPEGDVQDESSLFKLIEKCTLDHLIADVPVGVFFSGGTDSSIIASVLHSHGINLETFSITVAGRDTDKKYFPLISEKLGLRSHVFNFDIEEFNDVYERVMSHVDEPSADISIFPTYFVSQKAREKVTVVLSGEGGDELFFGYDRQRHLALMRRTKSRARLTLLEHMFLRTPSFKGKNYLFQKLFWMFRQPVSAYVLFMSPSRDLTSPEAWRAAKGAVIEAAQDPLYFDRDLYLENALLRKSDFATMLNSVEGRVPLLDPLIISAARHFESAFTPDGESKPVLKRMLEKYLPHELVYRPKSGFGMSLPAMLPSAPELARDLDASIIFLQNRNLLAAGLPKTREELVQRYPNLCFALISLYRALKNNEEAVSSQG